MEKNEGYQTFYVWFKDALLSKNGYVKAYYEQEKDVEEESYRGLTDGQLQQLASQDNIEVLEHTAYNDPSFPAELNSQAMMMQEAGMPVPPIPMLHDVKIRVTETKDKICIKNVAPENMMISVDTSSPSLFDARFVQHREIMTRSAAAEQFGLSMKKIDSIFAETNEAYQLEAIARDIYNEEYDRVVEGANILVRDTYIRIDGELMLN